MKNRLYTYLAGWIFLWLPTLLLAQAIDGPTALFLMHSSGNHVAKDAQGGAVLEAADAPSPQKLTFIPDGNGYYALQSADGQGYLSLTGQWNTSFTTDPSSAKALYAIENSGEFFVKLRCKYNNKYLGTDGTTASSAVYSDKDGTDTRHLWYLASGSACRHLGLRHQPGRHPSTVRGMGHLALLVGQHVREVERREDRRTCGLAGQPGRTGLPYFPL